MALKNQHHFVSKFDMWNQEQQIIQSKLSESERLLWFGKPRQGFFFRSSDIWLVPFSIFWLSFAIYWNYGVWKGSGDVVFILFGIPFLCVGVYYVFGRFIQDILLRRKTFFGVTTERIIIVSGIFSQKTKYIDLKGLNEITLEEKSNGLGTITFGKDEIDDSNSWFNSNQNKVIYAPNFEQIPNAKNVYEIIRNAQKLLR